MSCEERLRQRIRRHGRIPFYDFMEEALYGPGGYYSASRAPIGAGGDYATGSSLSPLFGRTTARLLGALGDELGTVELLEAGYGNATHLAAVVESGVQASLRAWDRVRRPLPAGVKGVADLDEIASREVEGLIFSYELFDALPVHRLVGREGELPGELWVALDDDGGFRWLEAELSDPGLMNLLGDPPHPLKPGQVADLAPGWGPLYRRLASKLGRGLLVTCDYGFLRSQLLDERIRRYGTLACYSAHRVHRDPFTRVARQDLSAHVDFSTLIEAGEEAGLVTLAFTRQALWLTACGLFEELQDAPLQTREQAMALLDLEGMGEEIRVLVQGRRIDLTGVLDLEILGAVEGPCERTTPQSS